MKGIFHRVQRNLIRKAKPIILVSVAVLVFIQIVALNPSSLEEATSLLAALEPDFLKVDEKIILATAVPKGKIPEYTVEQFDYVSSQGMTRQWKLMADRAFMYQQEKLVHSRKVKAFLYDTQERVTVVTAEESQYFMNQKDLEMFGKVEAKMPDGFVIQSEYLRYRPQDKKLEIPEKYSVFGKGQAGTEKRSTAARAPGETASADREGGIEFTSQGLLYSFSTQIIFLPKTVRFTYIRAGAKADAPDAITTIDSDQASIRRAERLGHFTMHSSRPLKEQFVKVNQKTLAVQSRRADLNYGDSSQLLHYFTALQDVLIHEKGVESGLKYSTSGRADFDSNRNVIVLSDFPQVYQDQDTVTGEVIILHRDTDQVEVEHSNAYSGGSSS